MIISITENKTGTLTIGPDGLNTIRELTRSFNADVVFEAGDDIYDALYEIESASGVPARGDTHPANSWAFCDSIEISHVDGQSYSITASYKDYGDPESRMAEVQYTSNVTSETIDIALVSDGLGGLKWAAIENSSGEPYTVEEDFHDGVFTATGYLSTWTASTAAAMRNCTNNALWYGNAAGTLCIKKFDAEPEMFGTTKYWKWSLEIHARPDGWLRNILDQGTRTKDIDGIHAILDDDGNQVSTPVKLDGSGGVLADGEDAEYLPFRTKYSANFATLPITLADVS